MKSYIVLLKKTEHEEKVIECNLTINYFAEEVKVTENGDLVFLTDGKVVRASSSGRWIEFTVQ